MKITIERDVLRNAMMAIDRIVKRSETVPVLGCVKLTVRGSRLTITGTDLTLQASTTMTVDVTEPGAALIDATALSRAAAAAPAGSQIELAADETQATGKAGKTRFRFPTFPVADFPVDRDLSGGGAWQIGASDLKFLFGRCAHAMSTEETRYYLNGIHLLVVTSENGEPHLRAESTDGHRLARAEMRADDDMVKAFEAAGKVIVPRETVHHLLRLIKDEESLSVRLDSSLIEVTVGDLTILSKLIDGQFPDADRVIPKKNPHLATVDREALVDMTARIGPFAGGKKGRGLQLKFTGEIMEMSAGSEDGVNARDEMAIEGFAQPLNVGFNVKYLHEAIDGGLGSTVALAFDEPNSPVLITFPQDSRLRMVLMPIRV
ncbi:DNA polymerase III subunit beta [Dongia soli]|uniref:Beta sliding clamp n=1 Tax=Dongia soli TaxID=600628 RepID=A0ABU5E894_9PROT|nr:DNA polymerase III subunit beta [Dongia soli]MDY0882274.1 DNA polymerase III subunit beta [Dongia soli]